MTVLPWALQSASAANVLAQNVYPPSHVRDFAKRPSALMAQSGSDILFEEASPTFVVSVCLADFEYSSICREVGLLEATKRLKQIYLDVYGMRGATGSLRVWFPPRVERSEQLRFLREVEERAIAGMSKSLQNGSDQSTIRQMQAPGAYGEDASAQQTAQTVRKWREDASLAARDGTNWSHDWSSRMHSYRSGKALHELTILKKVN
jgi:hypothetical protein